MGERDAVAGHYVHTDERAATSSLSASAATGSDHVDAPLEAADPRVAELEQGLSQMPVHHFLPVEGSQKKQKWASDSVRNCAQAIVRWTKGPASPRPHRMNPFFPRIQYVPLLLLDKYLPRPRHRIALYVFYLALWITTFALVMRHGLVATEIEGWGTPVSIGCGAAYWVSGNSCGFEGNDCRPFNGSGLAFRCPGNCAGYSVLNPRAVGDQEVIYQPLIIGGPNSSSNDMPVYRGDSFICGAAIHAGIVSNTRGGCGVLSLIGTQRNYSASVRNGIESVGFDSYFPLSFTFEEEIECSVQDMRWSLLAVSVVFSSVLSLFTASPGAFFFPVFTGLYWTVGMVMDPPSRSSIASLFSYELGNFLPAAFVAWVMFDKMGIRRTLAGLKAQVEKTVLWLGACWVGALTNYTFEFIPIQRLTAHDLQQQPGARASLAIIIIVLLAVVVSQIWFLRQEARLIQHLKLYILFGVGLIICLCLPSLSLRIHHYILALLLLPGTSMQTRPSLLYQGLLVGFFINGIARWGWAPILETAYALQGDQQLGSPLPEILAPVIALGQNVSTITFTWEAAPGPDFDGISALVNDVERYRTYFNDDSSESNFTWTRNRGFKENEYFRFAWMEGSTSDDYTMAGTWDTEGEWVHMAPGPSRVRSRNLDDSARLDLRK